MSSGYPIGFIWGTSTAAHQVEGGNDNSDCWAAEHDRPSLFAEPSATACDSYNRYPQDMEIVRDLELDAYRFSIEWARVEPQEGVFSSDALAHYRGMVEHCLSLGLRPVVTLHHFTSPLWLAESGGWSDPAVVARFARYVEALVPVLEGVDLVCTINEPSILVEWAHVLQRPALAQPALETRDNLVAAHRAACATLARPGRRIGITLSMCDWDVLPGGEEHAEVARWDKEDCFLEQLAGDGFVGVQTYTQLRYGPDGLIAPSAGERQTAMGWRYTPEALGRTVRRAHALTGLPVLVTENGLATTDDSERTEYIDGALAGLRAAIADGVEVLGYLHWSLLDNFEWLSGYGPTFGLVSVDRASADFTRTIKPSAYALREHARAHRAAAR